MTIRTLPLSSRHAEVHGSPRTAMVGIAIALVVIAITIVSGIYILAREPQTFAEAIRVRDAFALYFAMSFIVTIGALIALARKIAGY